MARLNPGRGGGERGQAIVELALTLPLLLLVILGVLDFGFMFERYEVVVNAAREGARVGVFPGYPPPDAEEHARNYVRAGALPAATFVGGPCPGTGTLVADRVCVEVTEPIAPETLPSGKSIKVIVSTVSYDHPHIFLGPIRSLFGGSFSITRLRAVSVMRKEAN